MRWNVQRVRIDGPSCPIGKQVGYWKKARNMTINEMIQKTRSPIVFDWDDGFFALVATERCEVQLQETIIRPNGSFGPKPTSYVVSGFYGEEGYETEFEQEFLAHEEAATYVALVLKEHG